MYSVTRWPGCGARGVVQQSALQLALQLKRARDAERGGAAAGIGTAVGAGKAWAAEEKLEGRALVELQVVWK